MKRKAQELKQKVERARVVAEEAEKKIELVLMEAKDAKAVEQRPVKEINIFSKEGRVPNSKFSGTINMSNEDFEAMRAKAKECEDLVEKKEAIVMAELQQIYSRKNEVDRKRQPDSEVNDLVGEDICRVGDTNPFLFAISEVNKRPLHAPNICPEVDRLTIAKNPLSLATKGVPV
ncbi:hypothetical protein Fmac_025330 [Flemingia macrophylla]|uniref:Uncharacterized protein n=1 Tax=Flemingia macrophylla TaxID=520843 RepID=A0ABD1LRY4_9FABA